MTTNPLNDISRIYLEQVAVDEAKKEKPDYLDFDEDGNTKESMKKALRDKAKKKGGVAEELKGNQYKLDVAPPFGELTSDDLRELRKGKKKKIKEGFSNWREDLIEIADKIGTNKSEQPKIVEKQVDNKIEINPKLDLGEAVESLGGTLLEMVEIEDDLLTEEVNLVADYFYEQGLNEDGVNILIEELGLDEFVSFVFEIAEEYTLTEAKFDRLPPVSKSGKNISSLKGGAKTSAIKSKRQIRATLRQKVEDESKSKPGFKSFSQKHVAVKKAVKQQSSKKPVRDAIARGIFGAVKAYQAGVERHKKAMNLARETGKTVAKVSAVTHEAGRRAGESKIGQTIKKGASTAGKAVAKKIRSDIETTKNALKKEEFELDEKVLTTRETRKKEQIFQSVTMDKLRKQYPEKSEKELESLRYAISTTMAKKIAEQALETPIKSQQTQQQTQQDPRAKQIQQRDIQTKKRLLQQKMTALQKGSTDIDV